MSAPVNEDMIVLDVSHWQEINNFAHVVENGTAGVILKCTQGTTYIDPTYFDRASAANGAGLLVSAYHFLEHADVAEQMAHFVEYASLPDNGRVCIDFEENPNGPDPTLDDLLEAVRWLLDNTSYEITVYGSGLLKSVVGNDYIGLLAANTSLWIAHYTDKASPDWPKATWKTWSLWQWTQSGGSPGIAGSVDCNRWNGDPSRLADWFYRPEAAPIEPDEPVNFDFGSAVICLKQGDRVARDGWNGRGMWLELQVPDPHSKMTRPYIYMKTVDEQLVPWVASQTDMLAEDWRVV